MFANLSVIRLRHGASDNLFALSQFVLVPAYCTLPFPERRERGAEKVGLSRVSNPWAQYAAINT